MTDKSLPQSLLSLLNSVGLPVDESHIQSSTDSSGDDLNLGHVLSTAAAGWIDQFVYSPVPAPQIAAIETDVSSLVSDVQSAVQPTLHHFFDSWVNLLAPWAQGGAATFVSSAVDAIHDLGSAIVADLHNIKGPHSQ